MEKILSLLLIITFFLSGCRQGRGSVEVEDMDFDEVACRDDLFDSLMWLQYHCPEDEEKTVYEWNWAYDVRETLGVDDLDSLTILSWTQCIRALTNKLAEQYRKFEIEIEKEYRFDDE